MVQPNSDYQTISPPSIEVQSLAKVLHATLCYKRTDQCRWHAEDGNNIPWNNYDLQSTRAKYALVAQKIVDQGLSVQDAINMLAIIQEGKIVR